MAWLLPQAIPWPNRQAEGAFQEDRHPNVALAIRSEELRDRARRARSAVALHRPVVDLAPDLLGDRDRDLLGAVELEVHPPPCPVALEAMVDVEVLLEVVAKREIQE